MVLVRKFRRTSAVGLNAQEMGAASIPDEILSSPNRDAGDIG